ncbi:hypothetical protein NYO67_4608 [Aspergillus flavus]|nr:hypothetical protein NYO67_4608 [Aspergillus flavus]
MSLIRTPLVDFDPLYHARCVAPSPDGGICGRQIGDTERIFAQTELSLLRQEPSPERRARGFRNAARLMICDNHKDRSEQARTVARLWQVEAAQQSKDNMRSMASIHVSSYGQPPKTHTAVPGGMDGSPRRPAIVSLSEPLPSHIGYERSAYTTGPSPRTAF